MDFVTSVSSTSESYYLYVSEFLVAVDFDTLILCPRLCVGSAPLQPPLLALRTAALQQSERQDLMDEITRHLKNLFPFYTTSRVIGELDGQ